MRLVRLVKGERKISKLSVTMKGCGFPLTRLAAYG